MGSSVSAEQQSEVWEAVDRADIAEVQRLVHKEAPIEIFTSFSNPNWRVSEYTSFIDPKASVS